jgi:hypothetical protein
MSLEGQLHALPRSSIAVRFTPVSGIDSRSQALPSRARSRHAMVLGSNGSGDAETVRFDAKCTSIAGAVC